MLPVLAAGGGYCALIIAEPNMSVTVVVAAVTFGMLFLSGAKMKYFLLLALPALLAVPVMILAEPYRLLRLSAFLDPWSSPKDEGYQLIQSLYALGNGGWFGTGIFRSRQKYRFLPFAESDFILAVIGEEVGFVGIVLLFALCAFIIFRGIKIAASAQDFFSFLLAAGITLTYGLQTIVNALVVSGSIPPTGIPLPLVSSGNTALIVSLASFGVLYRISLVNKNRLLSYNKNIGGALFPMDKFIVQGGLKLYGKVNIQAAKNAVLPLLAASILTDERVTIRDLPFISDVENMIHILRELGCEAARTGADIVIDGKTPFLTRFRPRLRKNSVRPFLCWDLCLRVFIAQKFLIPAGAI